MPEDRAVAVQDAATERSTDPGDREPEERRIDSAVAAGDADTALPLLMDRYGANVYRYCRRMLGTDADADDVSQIVFLQAFQAIRKRPRIDKVRGWLLGIARNRCLDRLQKERRGLVPLDREGMARLVDTGSDEPAVRDPGASRALDECLDQLDARSRMVVLLRFRDQLSYDEISEITGDQPGALRVRVARALPALRGCLEKKGGTP